MHRANSSFGYGMMVTHTQLMKAYSAFNNDGLAMTPRIVDYLQDAKGNQYKIDPKIGDLPAVSKKAANQIHDILLEVVKRGTGVNAQYPGLEIGGKTGTAHIAKNGRYVREYHSSFYGFANDKEGHKYTIGVLVIRAKKYHKYFASQSAVPTFKRTVDILVELDYLKPENGIAMPSPEIRIEEKKPALNNYIKEIIDKKTTKDKPQRSVKELFKIQEKKEKKTKTKKQETKKQEIKKREKSTKKTIQKVEKPVQNKAAHELFEDLF